jgi:hypothetical protein
VRPSPSLPAPGLTNGAGRFFSYFTHLSYTGLLAYFWAAGVQTALYARNGRAYPLQRWPRVLQVAHVALQSTAVVFPVLVTAVFWALLSGPAALAPGWPGASFSLYARGRRLRGRSVGGHVGARAEHRARGL